MKPFSDLPESKLSYLVDSNPIGMEALRPNDKRAKSALTFFWILLILEALSGISGYQQFVLLQDIQSGVEVSESRASLNDLREGAIALLSLATYIACIVLFLMWFRRAAFNLGKRVGHLTFKDDGAVYSWFIPFVNLYRPYQIMRELYEETQYLFEKHSISTMRKVTTDFLGIWWALWIINGIVGQIVFRISMKAESVEQLLLSTRVGIASNVIGALATLAAIKVISDYAKVEGSIAQVPEAVTA